MSMIITSNDYHSKLKTKKMIHADIRVRIRTRRNKRRMLTHQQCRNYGLNDKILSFVAVWVTYCFSTSNTYASSFSNIRLSNAAFCNPSHNHNMWRSMKADHTSDKYNRENFQEKTLLYTHNPDETGIINEKEKSNECQSDLVLPMVSSRRKALQYIASTSASLAILPLVANAGVAEIDSKSGELFSPKREMLGGGGSDLARGIKLQSKTIQKDSSLSIRYAPPTQTIYNTRFIAYLSRFLLNFDPAAGAWWAEQDFQSDKRMSVESKKKLRFAEFAESVEVGLADYFIGPYGSYASVEAGELGA